MTIEAMKQALEALEKLSMGGDPRWADDVMPSLRQAIEQAEKQEPVAMLERDPSIGRLRVTYEDAVTELDEGVYPLYIKPQGWRDNVAQAYLKGFDDASVPLFKTKERLIRIMGTFDLATGHGDTMEELLDSLESELRDVLGHYREALKQNQNEPVAWSYWQSCLNDDGTQTAPWVHRLSQFKPHESIVNKDVVPLYTTPQPQREWFGLTDEERKDLCRSWSSPMDAIYATEAKLKEKNNG
jgi:hypothetical protein